MKSHGHKSATIRRNIIFNKPPIPTMRLEPLRLTYCELPGWVISFMNSHVIYKRPNQLTFVQWPTLDASKRKKQIMRSQILFVYLLRALNFQNNWIPRRNMELNDKKNFLKHSGVQLRVTKDFLIW